MIVPQMIKLIYVKDALKKAIMMDIVSVYFLTMLNGNKYIVDAEITNS